jgi:TolB protein
MKHFLINIFIVIAICLAGCNTPKVANKVLLIQTPKNTQTAQSQSTSFIITVTQLPSLTQSPSLKATQIPDTVKTTNPPLFYIGGGKNQLSYWAQTDNNTTWNDTNIYLLDLDGQSEQGYEIGKGMSHTWSPDGSQIVFMGVSESSLMSQIYIMDANGKNKGVLVQSDASVWEPAWSPDGKHIAYSDGSIYIINSDGTDNKLILDGSSFFKYGKPAWSPDSEQISFFVPTGLCTANKDGSNIKRVAGDTDWSSSADWSPDGQWIVYGCHKKDSQICVIKPDRSNIKVLTNESINAAPQWSPDGEWIAFESYRDGNWEIYIMRADGTEQRRITNDSLDNFEPQWRP